MNEEEIEAELKEIKKEFYTFRQLVFKILYIGAGLIVGFFIEKGGASKILGALL